MVLGGIDFIEPLPGQAADLHDDALLELQVTSSRLLAVSALNAVVRPDPSLVPIEESAP